MSVNITHILHARELGVQQKSSRRLLKFFEMKAATSEMKEIRCQLPASVKSAYLMCFSPDCSKVASNHGDHNIYISDVESGKVICTLRGHRRTPWSIAFHPTSNEVVASGCLGGEVRIWHLHGGYDTWTVPNHNVIASLAFHPFHQLLVFASGNSIYFWNWKEFKPILACSTGRESEKVRFLKFDRFGHRLITGILNVPSSRHKKSTSTRKLSSEQSANFSDFLRVFRRSIVERLVLLSDDFDLDNNVIRIYEETNVDLEANLDSFMNLWSDPDETAFRSEPPSVSIHLDTESTETESSATEIGEHLIYNDDYPMTRPYWMTFFTLRNVYSALNGRVSVHDLLLRNSDPETDIESLLRDYHPIAISNEPLADYGDLRSYVFRDQPMSRRENYHFSNLIRFIRDIRNTLFQAAFSVTSLADDIDWSSSRNEDLLHQLLRRSYVFRVQFINLRQQILNVAARVNHPLPIQRYRQRADLALCLRLVEMVLHLLVLLERFWKTDHRISMQIFRMSIGESREPMLNAPRPSPILLPLRLLGQHAELLEAFPHMEIYNHFIPLPRYQFFVPPSFRENLTELFGALVTDRSVSENTSENSVELSSENEAGSSSGTSNSALQGNIMHHQSHLALLAQNRNPIITENIRVHQVLENILVRLGIEPASLAHSSTAADEDINCDNIRVRHLFDEYLNFLIIESSRLRRSSNPHMNMMEESSGTSNSAPQPDTLHQPYLASSADSRNSAVREHIDPESLHAFLLLDQLLDYLISNSCRRRVSSNVSSAQMRTMQVCPDLCNTDIQTHRIQSWEFRSCKAPDISDASANIVVQRCLIHNDASIDISQDAEKLIALIPPDNNNLNNVLFAVYSLRPCDLGKTSLCIWGFVSNAISVSFSPLSEYAIVGVASSRPFLANLDSEASTHILKIEHQGQRYQAKFVRSLTPLMENTSEASLNSVKWLPESGQGLAYVTNKGGLCLCKPRGGRIAISTGCLE